VDFCSRSGADLHQSKFLPRPRHLGCPCAAAGLQQLPGPACTPERQTTNNKMSNHLCNGASSNTADVFNAKLVQHAHQLQMLADDKRVQTATWLGKCRQGENLSHLVRLGGRAGAVGTVVSQRRAVTLQTAGGGAGYGSTC
jgi:hypothetical protein